MFDPKYKITHRLLKNVKRIAQVVAALNERRFPHVVLVELEREAREVSSFASTSIEGNPLPLTDVKRILKHTPTQIRNTEREVLNYNKALEQLAKQAGQSSAKLTVSLILGVHKQVTLDLLPKYVCGRFRKESVFVNDPKSRKTIFWPPDHKDVTRLMNELVDFIYRERDSIDFLILAGIFHKQFVLIHPFLDGNGRTVRLVTKVILAGMGLNTFNLFSFERYYNMNVTKYFTTVGERGNYYDMKPDFTEWLEYFTDGVLDELLRVQKELEKTSKAPASGLKDYHHKILKYLREYGSITDEIYAKLVKRAKATRALDFRYMLDEGLIQRHGKGRATYYRLKGS